MAQEEQRCACHAIRRDSQTAGARSVPRLVYRGSNLLRCQLGICSKLHIRLGMPATRCRSRDV